LEVLIKEVECAPEPLISEVLDFARYLKSKNIPHVDEMLLFSESALSKDWLRPEEDEAWKDL
jgi:hypothetical protein